MPANHGDGPGPIAKIVLGITVCLVALITLIKLGMDASVPLPTTNPGIERVEGASNDAGESKEPVRKHKEPGRDSNGEILSG